MTMSAKWRREIFICEVLTTTRHRGSINLSFFVLAWKPISAKQAKVYIAYDVKRDQYEIIAKHLI